MDDTKLPRPNLETNNSIPREPPSPLESGPTCWGALGDHPMFQIIERVLPPGSWTRWNVRQPSRSTTWDGRANCLRRSA